MPLFKRLHGDERRLQRKAVGGYGDVGEAPSAHLRHKPHHLDGERPAHPFRAIRATLAALFLSHSRVLMEHPEDRHFPSRLLLVEVEQESSFEGREGKLVGPEAPSSRGSSSWHR